MPTVVSEFLEIREVISVDGRILYDFSIFLETAVSSVLQRLLLYRARHYSDASRKLPKNSSFFVHLGSRI